MLPVKNDKQVVIFATSLEFSASIDRELVLPINFSESAAVLLRGYHGTSQRHYVNYLCQCFPGYLRYAGSWGGLRDAMMTGRPLVRGGAEAKSEYLWLGLKFRLSVK